MSTPCLREHWGRVEQESFKFWYYPARQVLVLNEDDKWIKGIPPGMWKGVCGVLISTLSCFWQKAGTDCCNRPSLHGKQLLVGLHAYVNHQQIWEGTCLRLVSKCAQYFFDLNNTKYIWKCPCKHKMYTIHI